MFLAFEATDVYDITFMVPEFYLRKCKGGGGKATGIKRPSQDQSSRLTEIQTT